MVRHWSDEMSMKTMLWEWLGLTTLLQDAIFLTPCKYATPSTYNSGSILGYAPALSKMDTPKCAENSSHTDIFTLTTNL